ELQIPGMPLRFSRFPDELPLQAPYLGEHNAAVLSELLVLNAAEIDKLTEQGVIAQRLPS
ncbi:MAG TPA: carnitine dehydratase, partial [Porticoccaceae bacterium]|nr:carnitine dehydratase [Porticoccaceae bacterium]